MRPMPNQMNQRPLNPHSWRKFAQAQDNARRALNLTRNKPIKAGMVAWAWNGTRRKHKQRRRERYWLRQMKKWMDKMML